jgi:SAM-dependent methyltransferase
MRWLVALVPQILARRRRIGAQRREPPIPAAQELPEPTLGPDEQSAVDHLVRLINDAWVVSMLAIGERTGLLAALAASSPCSGPELASAAGLHPRYVQEWIWIMAAARIVDVDGEDRFTLRPGYELVLTDAGGSEHWSRLAPQVTAFARLEDLVVGDFRLGQGLPPSTWDPLIDVLAVESGSIFDATLLDEVIPRLAIDERLQDGARVLDLGCGEGAALQILAGHYPRSSFIGLDLSPAALDRARSDAETKGLENCSFEQADIEPLDVDGHFDLIMAANAVHDLGNPAEFFGGVRDALSEGGVFCMHEIGCSADMKENIATNPHVPGTLGFSIYHCLPLSLSKGGIAPGGMWGRERYISALREAGFGQVEIMNAAADPLNDVFIARV